MIIYLKIICTFLQVGRKNNLWFEHFKRISAPNRYYKRKLSTDIEIILYVEHSQVKIISQKKE